MSKEDKKEPNKLSDAAKKVEKLLGAEELVSN